MIKKFLLSFLIIVLLASISSAAVDMQILVKKDFKAGETVTFDYILTSDRNEEISFTPAIKCINGYEQILTIKTVNLKQNEMFRETFEGFEVTESMDSMQCVASVKIVKPYTQVKEEIFKISTMEQIDLSINLCRDEDCLEKSNVFTKGERIYITYNSNVENPNVNAALTFPDGSIKVIDLPETIRASELGGYSLEVTASKEGYKPSTLTKQFSAIQEQVNIPYSSPSEEISIKGVFKSMAFAYALFIFTAILLVVAVILLIKSSRKKS
jgi:hypothetical protein